MDGLGNDVALLDVADHATPWNGLLFIPAALWTADDWGNGIPAEPLRH